MFNNIFVNPKIESSQHSFARVPQANIPRSTFNRSHGFKTTFDAGYLIPCFVDEALPGDTFKLKMTTFARLATPAVPWMDNLHCDAFFFAVPYRLVWNNWEKFNGAQDDPGDSTDFLIPTMTSTAVTGYSVESLHDYFGIPTGIPGLVHSSLWHRAYNLIYNQWFRDQNLQDSLVVDKDDGPDSPTDYVLKRRGKRHDYFTSALPWPQKGPGVSFPLGSTAPVLPDGNVVRVKIGSTAAPNQEWKQFSATGFYMNADTPPPGVAGQVFFGTPTGLFTDLTNATAETINSLRQAFQVQKIYERDARGGTRYTELIKAHFGVSSPDERLQRPEFLGGG